jgi:CheY-like chemotaxis protein
MISTMAIDQAQRRVQAFQQRCGEYGEAALHLAYHSALPVALNAELLHLLRINFFLDPPEILPYTVEFEFLLSSLCREIDEGLYEIEPDIRDVLLAGLSQTYDAQRTRDIATLLWQYVDRHSPWSDRVELERAQQLTALNFLNPEKAQQWLVNVETEVSQGQVAAREWFVAMRKDIENQAQHLKDSDAEETQGTIEASTTDFFVSYNRHDHAWAEWIAWTLETAGYSIMLQAGDFRPGGNFVLEMQKAASEAERTIAVLSENYLKSEFTAPEWAAVFAQDPIGKHRKLIPVRVNECRPPGLLQTIAYVNLVGVPEREAQKRLLEAVQGQAPEQQILGQVPFPGDSEAPEAEGSDQLTASSSELAQQIPLASLRSLSTPQMWTFQTEVVRIGRAQDNDLVLPEMEGGISRQHAEISRRYSADNAAEPTYFLRDFSRFGTWVLLPEAEEWQKIHQQEVELPPGTQLKFGSSKNLTLEFSVTPVESLGQLESGLEVSTEDVETVGTVLWVDDRPNNNILERQDLEALGVSFVLATSTKEALEKLNEQHFDAIISDMGRPPDSRAGYTLLDRLRSSGNQIPFVIYASSRDPAHVAESRRRGAVGCTNNLIELSEMVLLAIRQGEGVLEHDNQSNPATIDNAKVRNLQQATQSNIHPVQVFISYAHEDEVFHDQLVNHLSPLRQQRVIAAWHDRCSRSEKERNETIDPFLESADIILFLISANFLASDTSREEVNRALERHEAGEARVLPIILRPVDLQNSPLSHLQALPKNAKPITAWGNRDEAFLNVIQGIREAAEKIMARSQPAFNQLLPEQRRRLEKRQAELQEQHSLLNRQLQHLRRDYAIETNAAMRLQFQKRIEAVDLEVEQLESSLESLEQQLHHI